MRASYGSSLLVALGWHATVAAAMFTGLAGLPAEPVNPDDCGVIFGCLSPVETAGFLVALVGVPVGAGMVLVSLAVVAGTSRVTTSPILAGTIAAGCGGIVAAVVAGGWLAVAR